MGLIRLWILNSENKFCLYGYSKFNFPMNIGRVIISSPVFIPSGDHKDF